MGFRSEGGRLSGILVILSVLAAGGTGTAAPDPTREEEALPFGTLEGRGRRITLAEALALGDRQALEARRARAQARIARGEEREALLGWVPTLTAAAGYSRTDGQVQGSFGDFSEVDFRSTAPYARLEIALNPAEAWFSTAAASRRAESAADQEQAVRRLVLVRVAELYYELVRRGENRRLLRLGVEDTRDLSRIADVLLRQGTGRGDDAERARAQLASAEQRLLDAERGLFIASVNLAAALDLDPTVVLVPADDVARERTLVTVESDAEPVLGVALETRPEVAAARRQVEALGSQHSVELARVAAPTVEAFYRQGATGESYSDLDALTNFGVAVSWSLSARGFARVRTADERLEEARLALAQVEQTIRVDVLGAWSEVRIAAARLARTREGRQAAESTLRISQVRYRNGASPAIESLLAEQQLDQARLAEVGAVIDYNQAQVRLRAQMGPVRPEDLLASPSVDSHGAK